MLTYVCSHHDCNHRTQDSVRPSYSGIAEQFRYLRNDSASGIVPAECVRGRNKTAATPECGWDTHQPPFSLFRADNYVPKKGFLLEVLHACRLAF